ncbi:hypothetical protein PINS_up014419 [Pythium insidiosum]|nr:hypothetical protein PINS_up014419 [Pythium insidiosum]
MGTSRAQANITLPDEYWAMLNQTVANSNGSMPANYVELVKRSYNLSAQLDVLSKKVQNAGSGSRDYWVLELQRTANESQALADTINRANNNLTNSNYMRGLYNQSLGTMRNLTTSPSPGQGHQGSASTPSSTPVLDGQLIDRIKSELKGDGMSTGAVIGIVLGVVAVLVLVVGVFVLHRRRQQQPHGAKHLHTGDGSTQDPTANGSHFSSLQDSRAQAHGGAGPVGDIRIDAGIQAVRVPLEKVQFGDLLSRGGFGEVYLGQYQGRPVAIKRLLPEKRKNPAQIQAFLAEVKFMSTMEHERIVQFIGVAWDSLSDLCVLSEFMEGGDLRSVLNKFVTIEQRPRGFDSVKVKIALHIAHALTYLHSLQPVVLHRDLKSKNILLDAQLNAKLTDFGVSRECADNTMTAGVGSSLWMAPEVMLGQRYDEKADVFSFGVVLSELDTHDMPYAHATEPESGRKLPDTAILQLVSLGRLQVAFSKSPQDSDMTSLAVACVALDPRDRPTTAEVLYRIHQVGKGGFC